MNPTDITRRTRAIGAPLNWDQTLDGDVSVLPVRDDVDVQSGARTMTSAWLPQPSELALLNKGLPVLLTIFGTIHPVVSVAVGQPFDVPSKDEANG